MGRKMHNSPLPLWKASKREKEAKMIVSEFSRSDGSGARISRHDLNGSRFRIEILKRDAGYGTQVTARTIELDVLEISNLATVLVGIEEKCRKAWDR